MTAQPRAALCRLPSQTKRESCGARLGGCRSGIKSTSLSFSHSVGKRAATRTVLARAGPAGGGSDEQQQQSLSSQPPTPLATAQGTMAEEDRTDLQKFLFPDKEELPDDMEMSLWESSTSRRP